MGFPQKISPRAAYRWFLLSLLLDAFVLLFQPRNTITISHQILEILSVIGIAAFGVALASAIGLRYLRSASTQYKAPVSFANRQILFIMGGISLLEFLYISLQSASSEIAGPLGFGVVLVLLFFSKLAGIEKQQTRKEVNPTTLFFICLITTRIVLLLVSMFLLLGLLAASTGIAVLSVTLFFLSEISLFR